MDELIINLIFTDLSWEYGLWLRIHIPNLGILHGPYYNDQYILN